MKNEHRKMNRSEISIFTIIRLPMAIAVVMAHAGLFVQDYPIANSWLYPAKDMLGWFGVPVFYFSSGFLFFRDSTFSLPMYKEKLKNRIKSLLAPYLLWNLLTIILYTAIQQIPLFSPYCTGMKNLQDYSIQTLLLEFWDRGDGFFSEGTPVLLPFWYLRNLILLSIASPLIYLSAKRIPMITTLILFGWWAYTPGVAYLQYSLFFFTLGSIFAIHSLEFPKNCTNVVITTIVIGLLDLYLHWNGINIGLVTHRIFILSGVFLVFALASAIQRKRSDSHFGQQYSFFVYAAHFPITIALCKVAEKYVDYASTISVYLYYFVVVTIVIVLCILMYILLKWLMPRVLNVLIGSR